MINQLENLSDYILRSKEERESHIDTRDKCVEVDWRSWRTERKKVMRALGVTQDINMKRANICLRHLCGCGTSHGKEFGVVCVNPKHIVIGTASENTSDIDPGVFREICKQGSVASNAAYGLEQRIEWGTQGAAIAKRLYSKAILVTHLDSEEVYMFPSCSEAARVLGLSRAALNDIANRRPKCHTHKGYTADWVEGPNPFY